MTKRTKLPTRCLARREIVNKNIDFLFQRSCVSAIIASQRPRDIERAALRNSG